jgi:glycosyl transferase family 4
LKVLALCYYAPPKLTPQAIQIGRQLYHLDARVTLLHGEDPDIPEGFDQYPDFYQRIASLSVPGRGAVPAALRHRLARRAMPWYGAVPDGLGAWRRRARVAALAAVEAERPDVLVSFGMPMTDHLLGLDLHGATGLPWLAHFSDPWAGNPFHPGSALVRRVNARLERRVVAAADQLLFTSQRTLEMVMRRYPPAWRARADVLPHAWDNAGVGAEHDPAPGPGGATQPLLAVRHIGAFYGTRSPEPLFAALAQLLREDPGVLDGVRFELVGPLHEAFLESAAYRSLPPGLVQVRGAVPYRESLRLTRDADALLVVDAPSERPSVFLPSKLVEYIGARRPVWGISPPGTSADLIAEWAGRDDACAAPEDVAGVTRMLRAGLDGLARGEAPVLPEHVLQRFAPERVAAGLRGHLQLAIERAVGAPARSRPRNGAPPGHGRPPD